jgi:hypothetical protein
MRRGCLLCLLLLGCPEPVWMGAKESTHGAQGTGLTLCEQAAVALRDDVPDYQKRFTEQFTVPELERSYDRYWYLTASAEDSQHERFVAALTRATAACDAVDVLLLAHGNSYIDWVAEVPAENRERLRLVYDTGGADAEQGPRWLELGAKAFVGHPGDNIAPLFYVNLLPAWTSGARLGDAVEASDRAVYDGLFGATSETVLDLVRKVGFHPLDPKTLWEGTRSRLYGDPDLRRAAAKPSSRLGAWPM